MLNSNDWHHRHDAFISESLALLDRCEECVAHLEMIAGDEDATDCLRTTLLVLTESASRASIDAVAGFARKMQQLLDGRHAHCLSRDALQALKNCLSLMAWQLELIDPRTGELPMDDDEQSQLLEVLAKLAISRPAAEKNAEQEQSTL